jgi:hypothetical protein
MDEVMEWADTLERLWNEGQLTEFAYKITNLYNSLDYRFVSETMIEFKNRISK